MTLGVAYLSVLQLGLPGWLFVGAATLVGVGLSVLVATALAERHRATAVMQAGVAADGAREWLNWRRAIRAGVVAWSALGIGMVMAVPGIYYWQWPSTGEWVLFAALAIASYCGQRGNIYAYKHGEASLLASLEGAREAA